MLLLSVVIPFYNEFSSLPTLLDRVKGLDFFDLGFSLEIILINDGSSDGDYSFLLDDLAVSYCELPVNSGKGAAIQRGFELASGDWAVIQDADLEYDPDDIRLLLSAILPDAKMAVFGSRFLSAALPFSYRYSIFGLANRFLTWFSNCCTGLSLSDMETCYKLLPRSFYSSFSLTEKRFGMEPELAAGLAAAGFAVKEVPISYSPRSYDEGKKIGIKDGIRAIWCIWRFRSTG